MSREYGPTAKSSDKGLASYRAIGSVAGFSPVGVMRILDRAMGKIVDALFIELRGRLPTKAERDELIRNDDFQEVLARVLREKKRAGGGNEPSHPHI